MTNHPFQNKKQEEWTNNDWADFWYYKVGVNPIPYNGIQKNTWVQWKNHPSGNFEETSIPLEIFEAWKKADSFSKGIAVICGKVFRGEHIEKWLNGIDFDNIIALNNFYPLTTEDGERKKTLNEYAQKNLIEQHDNKEKCHIYFYTKNRPILSKIANDDRNEGEIKATKPQIEIKSNASAIMNCTPSPHKDGSKLRILGTREILTVDPNSMEEQIELICKKYGIPYLSKKNNQGKDLPPIQSIIDSKRKMYAGEDRQFQLLRYLDSRKIRNPELNEKSLYSLAIQFGIDHFVEQYPENVIRQKVKDAMKFGSKKLIERVEEEQKEKSEKEKKSFEDDAISLDQLNDITDPKYADKLVKVKAIVSSNLIPYNIPHKINAQCVSSGKNHTIHDDGNVSAEKEITVHEKRLPEFVDLNSSMRYKILTALAGGYFSASCKVFVTETKSTTMNKLKIRPIMHNLITDGKKFLDDKGNKYSSYDIYITQEDADNNLTAGKEIEIIGYVIADPKNSKITIMAVSVKELGDNKFNLEKVKEIQELHKNKNTKEIINWYTGEFSKYSKIVKRENITIGTILNMFSSLGFEFEDEVVRGWVNTTIIGDSTTAKSKTVKDTIKLLKVGQIASGEMASIAGIAGASVQTTGGQWFTDYGLLPLQDKKALWLDGAHKIPKDEIDRLAEAERNGKIEINKASKGEAWARTRQGKIMNPLDDDKRDTTTMSNFIYPVQALTNLFQLQSIARIDLAIFVSDDVGTRDRNVNMFEKYDSILDNYSDLVKLIWSNQCEIRFEDGVIDEILDGATLLEDIFKTEEMPLITNDQKYKLAKLSISIAGFTCSFNDDYTKIIVKKEHVEYIINFIRGEYTKIGLADIKKQGTFGEINIKILHEIIEKINEKIDDDEYEKSVNLIKWTGIRRKFTKDEIMDEFSLTRDKQASPLLSYLANENMLKRKNIGFIITKKGIALTKFIVNSGDKIYQELKDEHDHLIKSFECNGCNTTWVKTRDTIEKIQKEHNCVQSGKIIEIADD